MKGEKLQDAIGMVDEEFIKDAQNIPVKKQAAMWWKYGSVAAACIIMVTVGLVFLRDKGNEINSGGNHLTGQGIQNETKDSINESSSSDDEKPTQMVENQTGTGSGNKNPSDEKPTASTGSTGSSLHTYAISQAVYPKDEEGLKRDYIDMDINIGEFYSKIISRLLTESNGDNKVCSPVNVYMLLCMLAEVTDGNSRSQILDLLGAEDVMQVREEANAIWKAHYSDDGKVTTILSNSLWMDKDIELNENTLKKLSNYYYASSYTGEMGSDEMNESMRNWLNEQTGNLLKEQVDEIKTKEDDILALASTIYYRARWYNDFKETVKGSFNGSAGQQECDFMRETGDNRYYWGENFSAVNKALDNSGEMWFVLPDDGVNVDELLLDDEIAEFMEKTYKWENNRYLTVNMSVPKFDVCSDISMEEALKDLGVVDIFNRDIADFSPVTSLANMAVSRIKHGARVAIDEEGCIAAAYTVELKDMSGMPEDEEVDFVVDRPFIFMITSNMGEVLFAGVVNQID